jgi:hypothetical protein
MKAREDVRIEAVDPIDDILRRRGESGGELNSKCDKCIGNVLGLLHDLIHLLYILFDGLTMRVNRDLDVDRREERTCRASNVLAAAPNAALGP